MKLRDVIPCYAKQLGIVGPQSWMTYKQYKSANAKNGGVIRWNYGAGKKPRNTY